MGTPNAFGIDDNFGAGGDGLAPGGSAGPRTGLSLRDQIRSMLGGFWAPGYANATALTASLAKNRQRGQLTVKLDDLSIWMWNDTSVAAADGTHIAPTDVGGGAGRWIQYVAAVP